MSNDSTALSAVDAAAAAVGAAAAGASAAGAAGTDGAATDAGAVSIQKSFYAETPPNDGHRRNILSTAVTQVGVSVLVDRGRLWVTVDFAAPR